MYTDIVTFCKSCPQCAIVNSAGRVNRPPLHPIPVQRPFQIFGIDIMDLPLTRSGCSSLSRLSDQMASSLSCKGPEGYHISQASNRGNSAQFWCTRSFAIRSWHQPAIPLDARLVQDDGKINTTAYHPQCDGMVERFNRTLKTILRKHAATVGDEWDTYLYGVLYAYRNIPHDSTGEKPSFLLYGVDCRSPTEAALMPPSDVTMNDIDVADYREQVVLTLSSARETAVQAIRKAQGRYKHNYDRKAKCSSFKVGDWVFVRFPQEESGRLRKLSRPWHGPYRITSPDVCLYYLKIHLSRVKLSPPNLPAGFYWYGGKKKCLGHIPKWVDQLLIDEEAKETGDEEPAAEEHSDEPEEHSDETEEHSDEAEEHSDEETAAERGSDEETAAIDVPVRRYPVTRRRPPPDRYGFDRDDQV